MFVSKTEAGKSEFSYGKVSMIAETDCYFVFIFSPSHAQIYDKTMPSDGTVNAFSEFITAKIGKDSTTVN